MIQQLEGKQLELIQNYLEKNNIENEPETKIALSNRDVYNSVEMYKEMNLVTFDCIQDFASNAGGMTTYHYAKIDENMYIVQAWIGEIQTMYNVTNNWVAKQNETLQAIQ
jgi:hypothetical protein